MSRGAAAEFAAALRDLRNRSGRPTYRQLAARAGYSPAVLSQAAAGRQLPSWPVARAFVAACAGDVARWEQLWREAERRSQEPVPVSAQPSEHSAGYGHAENLLALTAKPPRPTVDTNHLDGETAYGYLNGELSPKAHDNVIAHLVDCARCTRHIAVDIANRATTRPSSRSITVFLVDDQEITRRGVRHSLRLEPDIDVIGEAASVAVALDAIPLMRPRVVILEQTLPDGGGTTLCRKIRSTTSPAPACLVLSSYSDEARLADAVAAGAGGYLLKDASGSEIVAGVRTLAAGHSLFAPDILLRLLGRRVNGVPGHVALTPREKELLELIAEGRTNREIARHLYLAETTVKNYVSRLLQKFGAGGRTELALHATRIRNRRAQQIGG